MLKNINETIVEKVWHHDYFEVCKQRLSPESYIIMIQEINKFIDNTKERNTDLIVKKIIPKRDWRHSIWNEVYTQACSSDDCYSAQLVGLLVLQELIKRDDTWYFVKTDVASNMIYFNREEASQLLTFTEQFFKILGLVILIFNFLILNSRVNALSK